MSVVVVVVMYGSVVYGSDGNGGSKGSYGRSQRPSHNVSSDGGGGGCVVVVVVTVMVAVMGVVVEAAAAPRALREANIRPGTLGAGHYRGFPACNGWVFIIMGGRGCAVAALELP